MSPWTLNVDSNSDVPMRIISGTSHDDLLLHSSTSRLLWGARVSLDGMGVEEYGACRLTA